MSNCEWKLPDFWDLELKFWAFFGVKWRFQNYVMYVLKEVLDLEVSLPWHSKDTSEKKTKHRGNDNEPAYRFWSLDSLDLLDLFSNLGKSLILKTLTLRFRNVYKKFLMFLRYVTIMERVCWISWICFLYVFWNLPFWNYNYLYQFFKIISMNLKIVFMMVEN